MRKSPLHFFVRLAVFLVFAAIGFYFLSHQTPRKPVAPPIETSAPMNPPANLATDNSLEAKMRSLAGKLAGSTNADDRTALLEELRRELAGKSASEASAAIRHFLDSHQDAPSGSSFKVGKKGVLAQAPTLRVFLLDYLGQVDPAAGAAYAKTILASPGSPDEWAMALRNLGQGDTSADGRALLQTKLTDLLHNGAWQTNPSVGYLESFDAAVFVGGTQLVPALSQLMQKPDNAAVAHASYLALDRMVINNPGEVLAALQAQPDLMAGREQTRADFFARADVRDAQQRQVLENYLLNPALSPAELQTFAGTFPNANFMISDNLLTTVTTPGQDDLAARDAASLETVKQWLADPRFQKLQPQLLTIQSRLNTFVNQAAQK